MKTKSNQDSKAMKKKSKEEANFREGDNVWARDKDEYYHAKIIKISQLGDQYKYFVHFMGWARKFDSWLSDDNLLQKLGDDKPLVDNSKKMSTLMKLKAGTVPRSEEENNVAVVAEGCDQPAATQDSKIATGASKRKAIALDEAAKKKQAKQLSASEQVQDEEEDAFKYKIPIPLNLKRHLVEEWALITKEPKRLLRLPRPRIQSVQMLLQDFLDFETKKVDEVELTRNKEICTGLQIYFDQALPKILLYRDEREQYDKINSSLSKDATPMVPSSVYGTSHFLRLFVRLPRLMHGVFIESDHISEMHGVFLDIVKFLHKNLDKYVDTKEYGFANEVMAIEIVCEENVPLETDTLLGRQKRKTAGINKHLED